MSAEHLVGLSTCPDADTANEIADTLVDEGLAACVNIIPGLTSVYRWQGKTCRDQEWLLVMKTTRARWKKLEETVLRLHPDQVPEVIALPIETGLNDYLAWVGYQTTEER